ncbi:MAG: excinuclease ABC subunit UvrA, partial [Burkholderiales bacterium]|nr:excinuclease ABC subunit UvrA [Burkholderiales bacterium]
ITDQSKSLTDGALSGWTPKDPTNWELITALAKKLKFSLKTPWKKLKPEDKEAILYGTQEKIPVSYLNAEGQTEIVEQPFEGVIPTMERRWKSTDNKTVRSHLAQFRSELPCPACHGSRINEKVKCVHVGEGEERKNIAEISDLPLSECYKYFKDLKLTGSAAEPAEKLKQEILNRLLLLNQLGLGYLTLSRSSLTLSGGEAQRIRLSSQISSKLTGVTYVLDEPSIGLHQHDKNKLIGALDNLKKLGNTVIVVEHDEDTMDFADWIIDMGPAAGIGGGEVCAAGTPEEIKKNPDSLTGQYLSGQLKVRTPSKILPHDEFLTIKGARGHNLKNIDVSIPIGLMTVVTGVSGSGKSSLVNGTISALARARLNGAKTHPLPFDSIEGLEYFDKVIHVDQSPIGRTPRSNPATYTGVFQYIRDLFAETAIAKERGYGSNRFSFNMKGGRCEACEGEGQIKVEMNFLPDMYVPCDVCHGTRYNRETLDVVYKGYNIAQVLDMSVSEAMVLFKNVPAITRKLKTLQDVGLGYIKLGQSASTLSGGEAQRVRLAQELSRKGTGRTLYILDEPTSGLHFKDIDVLIGVLEKLRDAGNTILLIEHNMDMIRAADWIIDLGPEGGDAGGQVIACGTPQQVMKIPESKTGKCLLASS